MADDSDETILTEAKEAFARAVEAEAENRKLATEDLRFARLGEQWPDEIRRKRELDGRPVLTINRLPAFIRQVVNDARQNKPSIKTHPADSEADVETAEIVNGLIRNIEYTSDADVAYDTATECAVSMGWGYFTVESQYAHDDTFDMDLKICRVSNPFSVYADPYSTAADSSDWNSAFQTEWLTEDEFETQFPGKDPKSWDAEEHWTSEDQYQVANWWRRTEVTRTVLLMSDGRVIDKAEAEKVIPEIDMSPLDLMEMGVDPDTGAQIAPLTVKKERETKSWKVMRYTLASGALLKTEEWPGKFIPIIPVYGDELTDENGVRHLRSLIRDAKDPQRIFNYWRSAATELVALAPKVPFIGPKGAFASDGKRWATANTENHPFLEYDGATAPGRQPLDTGAAAGALQEALNASDDMKAIIGIYDPALGQRSNETSGKAILARQKESDNGTFHFQDNMSRAIRHAGRILIDLIPKFYSDERIIRVIGEDGTPKTVPLKQPVPVMGDDGQPEMEPVMGPNGQPMPGPDGQPQMKPSTRIFDLAAGKYDLTVTTGPSYSTQREETRDQLAQLAGAFPPLMEIAGDLVVKAMDWEGADEIAKRLKLMLPPQLSGGLPPQVQQMIQQGKQQLEQQGQAMKAQGDQMAQMQAYINLLEADRSVKNREADVRQFDAETKRLVALDKIEESGTNVPDAPGLGGDYIGLLDQARLRKIDAETDNLHLRTMKELTASVSPIAIPGTPQF